MVNQTLLDNQKETLWILIEAIFFLDINNRTKIYSGFGYKTFEEFLDFVKPLVKTLGLEKEDPSFEEIVAFLQDFYKESDSLTSNAPQKMLLDDLIEIEKQNREKTEEEKKRITEQLSVQISAYERSLQERKKAEQNFQQFNQTFIDSITEDTTPTSEKKTDVSFLREKVEDFLSESDIKLQIEKIPGLPEEEGDKARELLKTRFNNFWQDAVTATVEKKQLPLEEEKLLRNIKVPFFGLVEIATASADKEEIANYFSIVKESVSKELEKNTVFDEFDKEQKEFVGQIIAQNLIKYSSLKNPDWETIWNTAIKESGVELDIETDISREIKVPTKEREKVEEKIIEIKEKEAAQQKIIEKIVSPLTKEESKIITEEIPQSLYQMLPESGISFQDFQKLPKERQEQVVADLKTKIESAIAVSIVNTADQEKPERLTAIYSRIDPEKLIEFTFIPLEQRKILLSEAGISFNQDITQLNKPPSEDYKYLSLLKDNSLEYLEENITVITGKEINKIFLEKGVNKDSIQEAKDLIQNSQTIILAYKGVRPQEIQDTINSLTEKGESLNSKKIKELSETKDRLSLFLEKLSPQDKEEITSLQNKRFNELVRGNGEKVNTTIPFAKDFTGFVKSKIVPSKLYKGILRITDKIEIQKIKAMVGMTKIVLQNKSLVFVLNTSTYVTSRFSFLKQKAITSASKWFFKTSLGQGVKLTLEKAGVKVTGEIFKKFSKKAAKEIVTKVAAQTMGKIAVKLGLKVTANFIANTLAPFVGFILVEVGSKIVGWSIKGIKSLGKAMVTLGGITDGILNGLTNSKMSSDDENGLKYLLVGLMAFIIIGPLLGFSGIMGAFVSSERGGDFGITEPGEAGIVPLGSSINCSNPRHPSEIVICKLSRKDNPCNQTRITQYTWSVVDSCFNKTETDFPNKDIIKNTFSSSVQSFNYLQCVGFVRGFQASINQNLGARGDACTFAQQPPPSGYIRLSSGSIPQPGDLAVWGKTNCGSAGNGHIGIVVIMNGNIKVSIAQANGYNGEIDVKDYSVDSPTVYLRYSP